MEVICQYIIDNIRRIIYIGAMGKTKKLDDPAMTRVRELWDEKRADGWTMQKLGERMGYPAASARKSVSQFLKSHDPHIGMLRRFANGLRHPRHRLVCGY